MRAEDLIRGDPGPEELLVLGRLLGEEETVGLGCSPTPGAQMLARAAAAGVCAAGGQVRLHELDSPVQGAWLAAREKLPVSLFVEERRQRVQLYLFDHQGLPLGHRRQQDLEHKLQRGEVRRVEPERIGAVKRLSVISKQWAEDTARRAGLNRPMLRRLTAAVEGDDPANRGLREVLLALGCRVEEVWRPGIPAFYAAEGGFLLSARDERGALLDSGQMLALVTLIEMENGSGKVAVPEGATAAVELVAAGYNGTVLRLDRDGEPARELYACLPWLWSAPSAAARICARMGVSGQRLESLVGKTPRFHGWKREVSLTADRDEVLRAMSGEQRELHRGSGLRLRSGGGWVYVAPVSRRTALRIMAESADLETAAELCDFYARRAAELDRELGKNKA